MVKRLMRFSLRLFLLIVVADILGLILMSIANTTINLIIDIILTITLWIFIWMDSVGYGQKDFKQDKAIRHRVQESGYTPTGEEGKLFQKWFGFAAGLLAQLPGLILIIVICFTHDPITSWLMLALKLWNLNLIHVFTSASSSLLYLYLVPVILFSAVSGLAYLNGPAQQKKLETIIERNKTKKAKRVQDDLKNKQKKGAKRR